MGSAFSWAWKKFTENLGTILIAVLIYAVVILAVTVIWYVIVRGILIDPVQVSINPETGAIVTSGGTGWFTVLLMNSLSIFVFVALGAFLQAALVRGGLILADGRKKLELNDMFNFDRFGTILVAAVIVGALTAVGVLACFVGAIVVWFFTFFYMFFLIDKNLAAWDSVVASFNFVKDNLGQVFLLVLLAGVVYYLGVLACGIGVIVSAPVALLALTFGYRRLQGEPVAP